jgi:hypothetical protein
MQLPFTVTEFLDVFAAVNVAAWPGHVAAYALGIVCFALALRGGTRASQAVLALLAGAWAFVGIVYHLVFFARVNPAARIFGSAFLVQAALFAEAAIAPRVAFRGSRSWRALVGIALVVYAAIVYPLLGAALGHAYPRAPAFGVAPCPTTIFTFGVLFLATGRVPLPLVVVPVLWAGVSASAAVQLGIREDLGLVVAGVVGAVGLPWGGRGTASRVEGERGSVGS